MTESSEKERWNSSLRSLIADDENLDGATTMYKYCDFSNVAENELDGQQPSPSTPPPFNRGSVESSIRVQKFPVKLYAILAQKEFQDIITWLPHGRSWKILKPNLFESLVMPLFFENNNSHSFNRLVNAWSFRRISSGPYRGSYYHELFLRGKPHLQKYMRRLPKTHKKLPMRKEDEPDFYNMDKTNPLPALEEVPLPSAMVPMRQQQQQQGLGVMPGQMQLLSNPASTGISPFNDTFVASYPLMDLSQSRQPNAFPTQHNMSSMNGMSLMNSMGGMNGMGSTMNGMNGMGGGMNSMNGMGGMNGMAGMNNHLGGMNMNAGALVGGMNNMNAMNMNGIHTLRDSGGMGDLGGAFGGGQTTTSQQLDQFQRVRQIQQTQLFERQMGAGGGSSLVF